MGNTHDMINRIINMVTSGSRAGRARRPPAHRGGHAAGGRPVGGPPAGGAPGGGLATLARRFMRRR